MRLPVVPDISTKDGSANKNARLYNALKETKPSGETLAVIRPGLTTAATSTGNAGGLVCFDGTLISVYGTTLGFGMASSGGDIASDSWGFVSSSYLEYLNSKWYLPQTDFTQTEATYVTYVPGIGVTTTEAIVTATTHVSIEGLAVGNGKVIVALNVDNNIKIYDITGTSELLVTIATFKFCGIRYLNGLFIAVSAKNGETSGGTYIHTSADGVTWDQYYYADADLYDVSWDGSKYVLIGYGYPLATYGTCTAHTTDFSTFSLYQINGTSMGDQILHQICYAGGQFYATDINSEGTVSVGEYTSSDGITWSFGGTYVERYKYDQQLSAWIRKRITTTFDIYESGWTEYTALNPSYDISFKDADEWVASAGFGVWYITPAEATIPALATIAQGPYDFAQSPL